MVNLRFAPFLYAEVTITQGGRACVVEDGVTVEIKDPREWPFKGIQDPRFVDLIPSQ